jgi:hypothetical protein
VPTATAERTWASAGNCTRALAAAIAYIVVSTTQSTGEEERWERLSWVERWEVRTSFTLVGEVMSALNALLPR